MPEPTDPDAEVRHAVLALLRDWVEPGAEALDRFLARVADDFTGIGTAPAEYFANRAALRALTEREHAAMTHPFTVDVPWMHVRLPGEGLALAEGELAVTVEMADETFVEAPRFSMLLAHRDGAWRLLHFHMSVADAMQDEGDTMGDLLATRNRELEKEVTRRTAELKEALADLEAAQARLVQQEKMASLGQLTAGIAHEIKNPLNFVAGFASISVELAAEAAEETDPEERDAILADLGTNAEKIEAHARRADGIVRTMMAHARMGTGRRRPLAVDAMVAEAVERAVHGRRARDPAAWAAVDLDLGAPGATVDGVAEDLGRVLINLIDNALYAVGAQPDVVGAPPVRVSTRRVGDAVEIRVADAGPGMAEKVRARVFEPFFTTKPTGQGTGLGLSLSYDIVTQGHGGEIAVESAPGQGATFVVTLPLASAGLSEATGP